LSIRQSAADRNPATRREMVPDTVIPYPRSLNHFDFTVPLPIQAYTTILSYTCLNFCAFWKRQGLVHRLPYPQIVEVSAREVTREDDHLRSDGKFAGYWFCIGRSS